MKMIRHAIVLFAAMMAVGCNPFKSTAEAEKSAAEFHSLFDAGDFEKIYSSAHADFRGTRPKSEVIDFIRSVREKLRPVRSSTKTGWQANSNNLKTNVVLTYSTRFENGEGVETFIYRIADGNATLLGWHVNSNDLVVSPGRTGADTTGGSAAAPEPKAAP